MFVTPGIIIFANSFRWLGEVLTMRYVLLYLMVLCCGCSKFEIAGTHQQQDYDWKDSSSAVKSKFQGKLIGHKQEKTLNFLVGKTEVDGLPYGVTFIFFENELVSIFLSAQSQPGGEWTPIAMEANRTSDWASHDEYSVLKSKLTAKYGEGEYTNDDIGSIKWKLPNDFLTLWAAEGIVGIQYAIPYDTELGKKFNKAMLQMQENNGNGI